MFAIQNLWARYNVGTVSHIIPMCSGGHGLESSFMACIVSLCIGDICLHELIGVVVSLLILKCIVTGSPLRIRYQCSNGTTRFVVSTMFLRSPDVEVRTRKHRIGLSTIRLSLQALNGSCPRLQSMRILKCCRSRIWAMIAGRPCTSRGLPYWSPSWSFSSPCTCTLDVVPHARISTKQHAAMFKVHH